MTRSGAASPWLGQLGSASAVVERNETTGGLGGLPARDFGHSAEDTWSTTGGEEKCSFTNQPGANGASSAIQLVPALAESGQTRESNGKREERRW
jgi:hypothetical protein